MKAYIHGFIFLLLAFFLASVNLGKASAQITAPNSRTFQVKQVEGYNASPDSCTSGSYLDLAFRYDPDTIPEISLTATIHTVIDSTHFVLRYNGTIGKTQIADNYDSVTTTANSGVIYLPRAVASARPTSGLIDSLWRVQWAATRRHKVGETFVMKTTAVPGITAFIQKNSTDSLLSAADTSFYGALPGSTIGFLVTATSADTCAYGVGLRLRDGASWAKPGNSLLLILNNSVQAKTGVTVWIPIPDSLSAYLAAGNIEPGFYGKTATDLIITRIKSIQKD